METRANYTLIGLFTLLVVAAGFFFVYWFAVSETGQARREIRIVFEGSVAGLSRGSSVNFNGLRVGEVAQLRLQPDDPGRVNARVLVDASTPLRADTRARLEYQGLTGIAQVELTGGSPAAPLLTTDDDELVPTIIAEPSDFQDLIESARNIARATADTLERVNRMVDQNAETITATVSNVEQFSRALSDNAPAIDNFLGQVGEAAVRIGPLADSLDELSRNVNNIVAAVDPQSVADTVRNVESFTHTLADSREALEQIFADASSMTQRLNETSVTLETTLQDVSAAVRAVDAERINSTVANVEIFTQMLAENRDGVANVITGAATLTENLSATSARVDAALDEIGRLVSAVDPRSVTATLGNVESFSQTLADSREAIGQIFEDATSLASRLNDSSLKLDATLDDVGAAVRAVDAQRIESTIANVESFSETLVANRQNIDDLLAGAAALSMNLNATSTRVDTAIEEVTRLLTAVDDQQLAMTLANVEAFSRTLAAGRENVESVLRSAAEVVGAVDPQKIAQTVDGVERFAAALGAGSTSFEEFMANAAELTQGLTGTASNVDRVLADISGVVTAVDDQQLAATLSNVEAFSRTLADNRESVAEMLRDASGIVRAIDPARIASAIESAENFARALGDRSTDIEVITANAVELSEKLNASADRIDGVLQAAENFLGSASDGMGDGLFDEVREAVAAIRTLAVNLDARTGELTTGITRATGPAIQEYRQLADEGRRALEEISRAVRGFERNPQQLLFGGQPSVQEFRERR